MIKIRDLHHLSVSESSDQEIIKLALPGFLHRVVIQLHDEETAAKVALALAAEEKGKKKGKKKDDEDKPKPPPEPIPCSQCGLPVAEPPTDKNPDQFIQQQLLS